MADWQGKVGQFNALYEKFLNACDSFEDIEAWDKDENGEMESYYTNDLLSVILKLIVADDDITVEEVTFINKTLGFDYTINEVTEIYELSRDIISESFASNFVDGVNMLKEINEELAECYIQIFEVLTEIIAESDGIATSESDVIEQIKVLL